MRILLLALLMSAPLSSSRAQDGAKEGMQGSEPASETPTLTALAKELICPCPSCGGKALDQCEPGCRDGQERRDAVAGQLKEGKNREQVLQFMSNTFGAQVLGEPPREGFGVLSWAAPLGVMILGAVPVMWFSRRSKNSKPRRAAGKRAESRGEDESVAAALKDFDY